jgi:hypothetical protein
MLFSWLRKSSLSQTGKIVIPSEAEHSAPAQHTDSLLDLAEERGLESHGLLSDLELCGHVKFSVLMY